MAAVKENLQELQRDITCGICRSPFSEPVTMRCGHSFCRTCLSSSWRLGATPFSCPECRQVPQVREIPVVNACLAELTEVAKELCSRHLQSAEGQHQCVRHQLKFKLFCEDDQKPLCVGCSQSPDHRTHQLSPAEEAAHRCRKKLGNLQRHLGKHLKECKNLLAEEETPAFDLHWMIAGAYNQMHQILREEESQFLQKMKKEERAGQDRLYQHRQKLQELMLELRRAGQQSKGDLLREAKQLLSRSRSVLTQGAKVLSPEVREDPIPGMVEMLNRFTVDITLDPSSANSGVIVSEDLKSVKAREGWQFDAVVPYVFAEQAFSSGRQYWEVDVTQLPQWTLGIHTSQPKKSWGRNKASCAPRFLLSCVKKEEDYYLQTYPGSLNHRLKSPLPRVGVYLEHTPGTLTFYNVLQQSLIYRFYPNCLTEPVIPIFSPGPPLPGTEAGPMTLCSVDSHLCACCYTRL